MLVSIISISITRSVNTVCMPVKLRAGIFTQSVQGWLLALQTLWCGPCWSVSWERTRGRRGWTVGRPRQAAPSPWTGALRVSRWPSEARAPAASVGAETRVGGGAEALPRRVWSRLCCCSCGAGAAAAARRPPGRADDTRSWAGGCWRWDCARERSRPTWRHAAGSCDSRRWGRADRATSAAGGQIRTSE